MAWYTCQACQTMMVRFSAGPPSEGLVLCRACRATMTPLELDGEEYNKTFAQLMRKRERTYGQSTD
jgi:hypothetical protein